MSVGTDTGDRPDVVTDLKADVTPGWTSGWAVPMQRPSIGFEPNWSEEGFSGHRLRQVVRLTAGGTAVRVRLSNRYGASPLVVDEVTVGAVRPVTFGGAGRVVIPAGGEVTADRADLAVEALGSLTVTMRLPETTGPATAHLQAYATSYRTRGDGFEETSHSWYYLAGVDVLADDPGPEAVAVFGDSITDGFGSTVDADDRLTDRVAERLAASGRPRPVLNAGIGGNLILSDSAWFGEKALDRFDRDVLDLPRVGAVILFGGLNDFGFSEIDLPTYKPNPQRTADELIAAYRELIARARGRGLTVVGATMLPMKGAEYYTERSAAKIRAFNAWVRASGEFDAVADFHRAVADPSDPERLDPAYDSGDHKHPNPSGYLRMAEAVDLDTL
ncbi:SGNH/GDSL hydrolase family protein [Spirillospora sp. CA-294931]|uniref:SGNH/GDSL hydrolase family protein n=1 Tax=Spirillospora sp. CA-294931 TaxID=3240042 RepID=UPI003D936535